MSSFQQVKLEEIMSFKSGKSIKEEKRNINGKHFIYGSNGVIGKTNETLVTGNNIIIGRVGAYCGSLRYNNHPAWVTDNAIYGVCNENVDTRFIYLVLSTLNLRNYAGGSAQPLLNQTTLKNIVISIPDKKVQSKVSDILFNLNEIIQIKSKINNTLEETALTIYKQMFAVIGGWQDNNLNDSKIDLIPEGWHLSKLKDLAHINMGQSPKSEFYNQIGEGLPFHQGVTNFTDRFPKNTIFSSKLIKVAQEGDCLISVRAPVGRINIANERMVIGRGLSAISSKNSTPTYLLYTLKLIFNEEDKFGSGTIYNSINKGELENLTVLVPEKSYIEEFESKVSKFDILYKKNHDQILLLKELHEYLLPKLIIGDINVLDAAEKVKGVISNDQPQPAI